MTGGLDAVTQAMMRRTVTAYMTSTVRVLTPSTETDRYGKATSTYTTAATLKGQLSGVSGQEQRLLNSLVDGGVERREAAKLKLPWGTVLSNGQVVEVGGKRWNVAHVSGRETLGVAVKVLLTFREIATDEADE